MLNEKLKADLCHINNKDTRALAIKFEQALRYKKRCEDTPKLATLARKTFKTAERELNGLIASGSIVMRDVHALSSYVRTLKQLTDKELAEYACAQRRELYRLSGKGFPRVNPYKASTLGREPQDRSCCAIALMKTTGWSYDTSIKYCGRNGRLGNRAMRAKDVVRMLDGLVLQSAAVKCRYSKANRISITSFAKAHPVGRFFCLVRGHAFAIVDGVLFDHTDGLRRQIVTAYSIHPEYLRSIEATI